jgi:hypothetical protein
MEPAEQRPDESQPQELEAAMVRFLDGESEPGDGELLARAACDDPQVGRQLTGLLALDDLLRQRAEPAAEAFTDAVLERLRAEQTGDEFVSRLEQSLTAPRTGWIQRQGRAWRPWFWLAAAMSAAALVVWAIWPRTPSPDNSEGVSVEIVEAVDAVRLNEPPVETGQRLALRDLRLQQGLVRCRLDSGTLVAVHAPAEVEFENPKHLHVRAGLVTADVSPPDKGFIIETNDAQFVDLGTRFGVQVTPARPTEVVVFEGQVEVREPRPKRRERKLLTRLEAGEAVQVVRGQPLVRIPCVVAGSRGDDWTTGPAAASTVIRQLRDNVTEPQVRSFYRVLPGGMRDGVQAFPRPRPQWHAADPPTLPSWLDGADLVQTFPVDRLNNRFQLTVTLAASAVVYVFHDDRIPPPSWLRDRFTDTGVKLELGPARVGPAARKARKTPDGPKYLSYSVWKQEVLQPGEVVLGPATEGDKPKGNFMYGLAVKAVQ